MFKKSLVVLAIIAMCAVSTSEAEAGWLFKRRASCGGVQRVHLLPRGCVVRSNSCRVVTACVPAANATQVEQSVAPSTPVEAVPTPKAEVQEKPLAPKLPSDVPAIR